MGCYNFCPNQDASTFAIVRNMYRGDTFRMDVQITDSNRVPVDITGWTVWFTAKRTVIDPDNQAVVQLSNTTTGIVFLDALTGKIRITVPPLATRNFPDGEAGLVYDIQVKDTNGVVFTFEAGTLVVHPDVTRAIG